MRVYITKHALSKGIIEAEVEQVAPAVVRHQDGSKVTMYYAGEWHIDRGNAIIKAELMRIDQINKCKRTIELLESISFQPGAKQLAEYKYNRNTPVLQYTIDEKLIKEYPSAVEAAGKTGLLAGGISGCCRGEHKAYKGYVWRYKDKEK